MITVRSAVLEDNRDNLSEVEWSWDSALDCEGRTIWIADAHRGDGKRFIVRADDELIAFLHVFEWAMKSDRSTSL